CARDPTYYGDGNYHEGYYGLDSW
nr:immunoglobulin heavy chain junction region [Macaca mulatta]